MISDISTPIIENPRGGESSLEGRRIGRLPASGFYLASNPKIGYLSPFSFPNCALRTDSYRTNGNILANATVTVYHGVDA